jgi:hypothetical protein
MVKVGLSARPSLTEERASSAGMVWDRGQGFGQLCFDREERRRGTDYKEAARLRHIIRGELLLNQAKP